MERQMKLVVACVECGNELDFVVDVTDSGYIVVSARPCMYCIDCETESAFEDGYGYGHTDGYQLRKYDSRKE